MKSFKNHSRFLAMVLSLVMCLGLCQPAFAAGDNVLKTVPGSWPAKHLDITCNDEPTGADGKKYVVATCYDPVFTFKGHTVGKGPEDGVTVTGDGSGYTIKVTKPGVYQVFVKSDYTYDLTNTYIPEICPSCHRKFSKSDSGLYHYTAEENFTVNATYTLSYDLNGGTGNISGETKTVAATSADFTVTSAVPTREGYEFTGWTVSNGKLENGVVTVTWPKTDAKLTAQWKVKEPDPIPTPHEHDWSNWTVTTEPTCTKEGVEARTCTGCGEEETRSVEAKGHDWGEWFDVKAATCTEAGEQKRECQRVNNGEKCNASEDRPIAVLGHHLVADAAVAANCYHSGLTAGAHCDRCDYVETAQEDIPALAPVWGNWVENGEAATGHNRVCVTCNGGYDPHRQFAPHDFGEGWKIVKDSFTTWTDGNDGYMYRTATIERICEDCGYTETDTVKYGDHNGKFDEDLRREKDEKSFDVWYLVSGSEAVLGHETVTLKETDANVDVVIKNFDHYTFASVSRNVIAYGDTDANVYVYYTLNRHTLTVNYVYADGITAAPTHTETVAYGNGYSVTSPALPGFTVDKAEVKGTMGDEDVTVTVTYVAEIDQGQNPDNRTPVEDETIPDDETPTTQAPEEEEIVEDEIPMTATPEVQEPAEEPAAEEEIIEDDIPLADVPKTGDLSAIWYAATALSALGLTVLGRKKEENDD